MATYEELKAKGWVNLSSSEKTEYQAFKKAEEDTAREDAEKEARGEVQKEAPDNKMEQRLEALERALAQKDVENEGLRNETRKLQEGWQEYDVQTEGNKTATVKIYREDADSKPGIITNIKTFKHNAFNEETRKNDKLIYSITCWYDKDTDKEFKIDAEDLALFTEVETVEIIEEKT